MGADARLGARGRGDRRVTGVWPACVALAQPGSPGLESARCAAAPRPLR